MLLAPRVAQIVTTCSSGTLRAIRTGEQHAIPMLSRPTGE